jgi:hypothetical protein
MSQLLTAPEINPTTNKKYPTQDMQVASTMQIVDFSLDSVRNFMEQPKFSVEQLDWVKIARKNKTIGSFVWTTTSTVGPYTLTVNQNFVRSLITIGKTFNAFTNYSRILITIKPTSNSQYQGLLGLAWDPSPSPTFYNDFCGADLTDIAIFQQFQTAWITPDNTAEFSFIIPLNYPFEFFRLINNNNNFSASNAMYNYMNDYVFGTIRTLIYSPLRTQSTLLGLSFNVSAQILDLQTAGLQIMADN